MTTAPSQRARELHELIDRYWNLAYAEGAEGRTQDTERGEAQECRSSIDRVIAALRLPAGEGWPAPTADMVEAGRTAVMALECSGPKWTVRQHYDATGADPAGIPDELLDMACPMPKAARAELIYRAMLAAAPRHETGEG